MPYVIAVLTASLVIGCGAAFCATTRRSLIRCARNHAEAEPNERKIGETIARRLEQRQSLLGFGMEIPRSLMWRLGATDLLVRFRYLWAVIVFGVCITVATFFD